MAQLYPQAPGIHFDRLLRHTWAAMGFSFFGHHTGNLVTCKGMYKGVSKSCRTVLVKRSLFTLDVKFLHRLQSTPFCTNTAVPAFLPCLEVSLEVPFWNFSSTRCDSSWISSVVSNLRPFIRSFSLGRGKSHQGARSGDYGRWGITVMLFLAKNCESLKDLWTGALSW